MNEEENEREENQSEVEGSYNADDKASVNKARKKAARERILQDEVVRGIMSVREGRVWIYRLLEFCDLFGNPHINGQPDATSFNCGMQNVARKIWLEVEAAAPEDTMKMLKEAKENEK